VSASSTFCLRELAIGSPWLRLMFLVNELRAYVDVSESYWLSDIGECEVAARCSEDNRRLDMNMTPYRQWPDKLPSSRSGTCCVP
jgi:hypothetical protein